jgi:putative flippase GtrA
MPLAILYALLAAIATTANIGAQELAIRAYHGRFGVAAAVVVGTAVGLGVKYLLDKRYIFGFQARDLQHDMWTFVLYTVMGIATTLLFWAFEFSFNRIFETKEMRYAGALIGLGLGYWAKYHLDKRFVFRARAT